MQKKQEESVEQYKGCQKNEIHGHIQNNVKIQNYKITIGQKYQWRHTLRKRQLAHQKHKVGRARVQFCKQFKRILQTERHQKKAGEGMPIADEKKNLSQN